MDVPLIPGAKRRENDETNPPRQRLSLKLKTQIRGRVERRVGQYGTIYTPLLSAMAQERGSRLSLS